MNRMTKGYYNELWRQSGDLPDWAKHKLYIVYKDISLRDRLLMGLLK